MGVWSIGCYPKCLGGFGRLPQMQSFNVANLSAGAGGARAGEGHTFWQQPQLKNISAATGPQDANRSGEAIDISASLQMKQMAKIEEEGEVGVGPGLAPPTLMF